MPINYRFFLKIGIGLGTAALLSVSVSGVAFWSILRTLTANDSVQKKVETIDRLSNIVSDLKEVENGQQGYILTEENRYLDSYTSTLFDFDYNFDVLHRLLAEEPEKKNQLELLKTLINSRLAQMQQTINLRRSQGLEAVMLSMKQHQGARLTEQIQQIAKSMDAQERYVLFQRQQEAASNLKKSIIAFIGGVGFNLLIFGWVYRIIYEEMYLRWQAEKNIQQLNSVLEGRVAERTEQLEKTLQNLQHTQSQLVQQEKMSSLGVLVAGIAHEINNPVNFIHGNLDHVEQYTQDLLRMIKLYEQFHAHNNPVVAALEEEIDLEFLETDLQKIFKSMSIGTDRIRKIVLSLRNFSRLDESEFKMVDIHEGLESTLLILQHCLKAQAGKSEIVVIKNYAPLPEIQCYPGQLNQVFMNILVNAIDALEDLNNNSTENNSDLRQILIQTQVINEQWIEIAIADNGTGISEATQARVFDPFFTTKPVGKGTGMGMSISYKIIVEKHQGKLICDSTLGKGTNFIIQLPVQQPAFG